MRSAYCILFFILAIISCSPTSKIKDGQTAFDYKQYANAIGLLKEEYDKSNNSGIKAEKAYLIAKSYLKINDYKMANEWFLESLDHKESFPTLIEIAMTFQNMEQYDAAIDFFERARKLNPTADAQLLSKINAARKAIEWKQNGDKNYSLRVFLPNERYSNYSPAIYEDNLVVFTSDSEESSGAARYAWTGNRHSDLFVVDADGRKKTRFDAFINTDHNEGTAIFNEEYEEVYFTRCFAIDQLKDEYCKIMFSRREEGVWTEPVPLPFIKDNVNYGQPCLIEKGEVLVYSQLSEGGARGYDLWYSVKEDGRWTDPYPMPNTINSEGNEYFPTADGDTLYFSSDYLPGMGGLDIFYTYLDKDGKWSNPVNCQYPINSGADDFGLIISNNKKSRQVVKSGFFTSNRNASGIEQIYAFEKFIDQDIPIGEVVNETELDSTNFTLYLAGKLIRKLYNNDNDPRSGIQRMVPLPEVNIELVDANGKVLNLKSTNRGLFIQKIKKGEVYTIKASKPGYLVNQVQLNTNLYAFPANEDTYTINIDIELERIFLNQEIVLTNIYYDFNESYIRDDAKPTLNSLKKILIDNPSISIQLSSHTDCRGENEYNDKLSQARAQSAVDYLIEQGVASARLTAVGYGESLPLDNCECEACTEEQHQNNRRTSFKILSN